MPELTNQDAYNTLVDRVYAPVFFNKLARDRGYQPATREEAFEMLKLAGRIRNRFQMELVKQANARVSAAASLNQSLEQLMAAEQSNAQLSDSDAIKQAAADAISDPEIKAAALKFSDYLAQTASANA